MLFLLHLYHYHYLKSNKSSELKGSNYFIHFLNDDERGMSILELKISKSEGVKVRL